MLPNTGLIATNLYTYLLKKLCNKALILIVLNDCLLQGQDVYNSKQMRDQQIMRILGKVCIYCIILFHTFGLFNLPIKLKAFFFKENKKYILCSIL